MKLAVLFTAVSALVPVTTAADEFIGTLIRLNVSDSNSTGKFHVNAAGNYCNIGQNLDFVGGDFMSVPGGSDICCNACRSNGCESYTWTNYQGGTCWLKNKVLTPKIYMGAKGCIRGAFGAQVARFANCDMPGNDLYKTQYQSVGACEFDCWANAGCQAVTWTDYQGGTCYFKTAVTECVYKPGASTGVALNEDPFNGW